MGETVVESIRLQPHSTPDICPHLRWSRDQSSNRARLQSQLGQRRQARKFRGTSRNKCRSGRPLGEQLCRGCMPHSCSTMKAGGLAPASSGTPEPGKWWRASRPAQHHSRRRQDRSFHWTCRSYKQFQHPSSGDGHSLAGGDNAIVSSIKREAHRCGCRRFRFVTVGTNHRHPDNGFAVRSL